MKPRTLPELTAAVPTNAIDRSFDRIVSQMGQIGLALACLAAAVTAMLGFGAGLLALVTIAASAHSLLGLVVGWSTIVGLLVVIPTVVVRTVVWTVDTIA